MSRSGGTVIEDSTGSTMSLGGLAKRPVKDGGR